MDFSHIARVGRSRKEDTLTHFELISLRSSTQNRSSEPARTRAGHKQTSWPPSEQVWQNLLRDTNAGALL